MSKKYQGFSGGGKRMTKPSKIQRHKNMAKLVSLYLQEKAPNFAKDAFVKANILSNIREEE